MERRINFVEQRNVSNYHYEITRINYNYVTIITRKHAETV